MKLYYMDCDYYGSIVVVAASMEEAHRMAKIMRNYDPKHKFVEYDITLGLILVNIGDM